MNTCPHCGADPCLPMWRKLSLGPAASARCQVCGCRVGVDVARACVAMLPTALLILAVVVGLATGAVTLVALLVVCLTATGVLYAAWVPLVVDEVSNAQSVAAGRARIAAEKAGRQNR